MKFTSIEESTKKYGRHDLERLGLFIEMPYLSRKARKTAKSKSEGPNLLCGTLKSKCGNSDGYFEEFKRIFSKEAIKDRRKKPRDSKSNPKEKPPLRPSGTSKLHSTPGDHYGCFGGIIEAFSGKPRPKPPKQPLKKNFVTSPGPKGGPGYVDICFNKYPQHMTDRYGKKIKDTSRNLNGPFVSAHRTRDYFDKNPFYEKKPRPGPIYIRPKEKPVKIIKPGRMVPPGPAKLQGGCHAGCFQPFPEYKTDRKPGKKAAKEATSPFFPQSMALKTLQTESVVSRNVDFRMNPQNYKNFSPKYLKYIPLK